MKQTPYLVVTQFHGIDGQCVTITTAAKKYLLEDQSDCAIIFKEIGEALSHMHSKHYLHNDIKGDNIILACHNGIHPIIIDFGKVREVRNAKYYTLSPAKKQMYRKYHWYIAPELIEGSHPQSYESDIFSFGTLLKWVCKYKQFQSLLTIARNCTLCKPSLRPMLKDICEQLSSYI